MAKHKTGIVTGAGSGVGRETAFLLAQSGYQLILVGRTASKLQETANRIRANSPCQILTADLCDAKAATIIVDKTLRSFGHIDTLVNVAGHAPLCPIDQITAKMLHRCLETNLAAVVRLTAAAWPVFQRQQHGMIVNVSSMASVNPFPGFSIYAAAKVGLNMFTKSTSEEGKSIGVQAIAIAPGAIETSMLRSIFDKSTIPTNKTLSPMDVATVICDCINGTRKFESGDTILLPSPS